MHPIGKIAQFIHKCEKTAFQHSSNVQLSFDLVQSIMHDEGSRGYAEIFLGINVERMISDYHTTSLGGNSQDATEDESSTTTRSQAPSLSDVADEDNPENQGSLIPLMEYHFSKWLPKEQMDAGYFSETSDDDVQRVNMMRIIEDDEVPADDDDTIFPIDTFGIGNGRPLSAFFVSQIKQWWQKVLDGHAQSPPSSTSTEIAEVLRSPLSCHYDSETSEHIWIFHAESGEVGADVHNLYIRHNRGYTAVYPLQQQGIEDDQDEMDAEAIFNEYDEHATEGGNSPEAAFTARVHVTDAEFKVNYAHSSLELRTMPPSSTGGSWIKIWNPTSA